MNCVIYFLRLEMDEEELYEIVFLIIELLMSEVYLSKIVKVIVKIYDRFVK